VVRVDADGAVHLKFSPPVGREVVAGHLKIDQGAEFPQVASEDPQVARGWLGRWLGRMFGKDHA
jgi:hypothetical protein